MKKILIIGATGFIGNQLHFSLEQIKSRFQVIGTYNKLLPRAGNYLFENVNILNKDSIENCLVKIKPDIVVLLAGTKDLAFCERNPEKAFNLNARPAQWCVDIIAQNKIRTKLIFFSSDYVFDGRSGHYLEDSPTNPSTIYGKTKVTVEEILKNSTVDYKIIRTAAVLGYGAKYFDWIIKKLNNNEVIEAFENTYFSPTPLNMIIEMLIFILESYDLIEQKIIHVVGDVRINRFELAKQLAVLLEKDVASIIPMRADLTNSTFQADLSMYQSEIIKKKQKYSFSGYLQQYILNKEN